MSIREQIDRSFARWARVVAGRAWLIAGASLVFAGFFAVQLPALEVDATDEAFLHEHDAVRSTYDEFRTQFGRDSTLLVAIETGDVFVPRFLERLEALHRELEDSVPSLDDITSLINARDTRGEADQLIVGELVEDWKAGSGDLTELRARALSNPLYHRLLISEDATVTAIVLELDTYSSLDDEARTSLDDEVWTELADEAWTEVEEAGAEEVAFLSGDERWEAARATGEILDRHRGAGFEIHLAGGPVGEMVLMSAMQRDIALFVGASVVAIVVVLLAVFRRATGVLLPLFTVVLALLSTVGAMALAGVPVTLPIQVLPSFLLAVGVCDAIHLLSAFYRALDGGLARTDALAGALEHCGLAMVMTSLTTAGGLLSFVGAELAPVRDFGIFGPLGVLFALFFSLTLLPALLMLVPLSGTRKSPAVEGPTRLERALAEMGAFATRNAGAVLAVASLLLLLGLVAALQLRFSHDSIKWLPDDEPIRLASELIDDKLGGSDVMEVLVDTGVENGLQDPELLMRLDELRVHTEGFARGAARAGTTLSLADVVKETHQALNENRPEFYAIPDDPLLVAQELLLFENSGSDDLEDVADSQFSMGSFTIRAPQVDAAVLVPFIRELEAHFRQVLDSKAEVTMTGDTVITSRTFVAMIQSMASSYGLALLIVTPLMVLFVGSLRGGLVCMLPNLFPIAMMLGLMAIADVPLNFSTMMSAAVVLGVVVDDTIHFVYGFSRNMRDGGDPAEAVRRTLETTGRALFFTSVVLAAGFGTYLFATMKNLIHMGVFTSFAIIVAFLADILIAPASIMLLWGRWQPARSIVE